MCPGTILTVPATWTFQFVAADFAGRTVEGEATAQASDYGRWSVISPDFLRLGIVYSWCCASCLCPSLVNWNLASQSVPDQNVFESVLMLLEGQDTVLAGGPRGINPLYCIEVSRNYPNPSFHVIRA